MFLQKRLSVTRGFPLKRAVSSAFRFVVRSARWGYAPDENLTREELARAAFRGIRPAVGYPSLPDQRMIFRVAKMLDLPALGISLTENGAMLPQASVCGLYLASPHAYYFSVRS